MTDKRTLSMDVKVGDSLAIDGGRLIVVVEHKSGQRARLRFIHAGDVTVEREVDEKLQPEVRVAL